MLDHQIHFQRIDKAMIGVLDRHKADVVFLRKRPNGFIRHDLVRGAVQDQDILRERTEVPSKPTSIGLLRASARCSSGFTMRSAMD